MLSTNALSVFILHHNQNGICNKNLRSIQDIMCATELSAEKCKKVRNDFPNLAILTNKATPGEVHLTFAHATVGNNSFGESVVAFSLSGLLRLAFLCRLFVICLHAAFAFIVAVIFPAGVFPLLCPFCDGASENVQDLSCVQLLVEDCGLLGEWQEKDSVSRRPVPLIFRVREVAGCGAKEKLGDRETDIVAIRGESDVHLDRNHRKRVYISC